MARLMCFGFGFGVCAKTGPAAARDKHAKKTSGILLPIIERTPFDASSSLLNGHRIPLPSQVAHICLSISLHRLPTHGQIGHVGFRTRDVNVHQRRLAALV